MKIRLLPEVIAEVTASARYYAGTRDGLDEEFLTELRKSLDAVSEHPDQSPLHPLATGRRPFHYRTLERFPFHVVYLIDTEEVVVFAVAHHRRRPGYWRRRRG